MPRPRTAFLATALAASLLAVPAPAAADEPDEPHGGQAAAACRESAGGTPEIGPRTCRTLDSVLWNLAAGCRREAAPEEACSRIDGRIVSEQEVADYEASWVHRAHTLQRVLDLHTPLVAALVPASHNSFNAFAYPPTLSGMDSNHVYTMRDQLRMDMRGLEIDVHWAPSADGDPAHGMRAPIMCHGAPAAGVHVGCTAERHLREGLAEVRAWLDDNPDEFLLLYLENALDGDVAAHMAASDTIASGIGDLVLRTSEPCSPMPTHLSRADIMATGARVLIVGNCSAGAQTGWGSYVHERAQADGVWWESGSGPGTDYPEDCDGVRADRDYETTFVRHFEGGTWLQAMTATGGDITATETRRMTRCGVNLFGFDHLTPDDPRLTELIWSWAPDEPSSSGCATHGADDRFHVADCAQPLPFACVAAGEWVVTEASGRWSDGEDACAAVGGTFGVPDTGWENTRLAEAKPASSVVWLDYRDTGDGWVPEGTGS